MNIFDRTAIFTREKGKVPRRIPWDLIAFGKSGFFVSPMPIDLNPLAKVTTTTVVNEVQDLLYEDNQNEEIDKVIDCIFFESENDFISKFDGTFGYYDGNYTQSAEFGYPRSE